MKALAALLVLLLMATFAAPVTCGGWEGSAAERRACCQRAHHQHCQNQASADACCAAHEQGCHSASTAAASQVALAGLGVTAALPVPVPDANALECQLTARFRSATAKFLHGPPPSSGPPLRI